MSSVFKFPLQIFLFSYLISIKSFSISFVFCPSDNISNVIIPQRFHTPVLLSTIRCFGDPTESVVIAALLWKLAKTSTHIKLASTKASNSTKSMWNMFKYNLFYSSALHWKKYLFKVHRQCSEIHLGEKKK